MMEQRYRHMMEQVNMDEEFEADLLERIREGRPKRRPRPLRTALIAACVCLALVGTAVAAQVTGAIPISGFFTWLSHVDDDAAVGYQVERSGVGASLDDLSDEALAMLEADPNSYVSLSFTSWDEAETFLGLDIYANPMLERAELHRCSVDYSGGDADGIYILADTFYICHLQEGQNSHDVSIEVEVEIYQEGMEQHGYRFQYVDGTTFTEETYVSPSGLEMTIVHSTFADPQRGGPYTAHEAYFYVGGAQYRVRAMDQKDPEYGWTALKEVLDAFEFGDLT